MQLVLRETLFLHVFLLDFEAHDSGCTSSREVSQTAVFQIPVSGSQWPVSSVQYEASTRSGPLASADDAKR